MTSPRRAEAAGQLGLLAAVERSAGFSVRVSGRARHLSVRVFDDGSIEVVVPPGTRAGEVQRFVGEQRQWIESAGGRLDSSPIRARLPEELFLPATGERRGLRYRPPVLDRRSRYRDDGQQVTIYAAADARVHEAVLRRWLAAHGRRTLAPWLERLAHETGLSYRRVQIRGQRSRWGSCSPSGTISLNYCLLFLPPEQVQYLLLHELCHTRHMNHSRRYWALLARFEPDCRALDRHLSAAQAAVPRWAVC